MSKLIVTSLSAIVLALGVTGALAQPATPGTAQDGTQVPPTVRTDGPAQGMPGAMATGQGMMGSGMMQGGPQGQPAGQNDRQAMPGGMGGADGHMGQGMMGQSMMGGAMMGPGMMIAMMDTNGDGALSLDEFQAMHTRMFNYLDTNHDGKVTPNELKAFHGGRDGDQTGK